MTLEKNLKKFFFVQDLIKLKKYSLIILKNSKNLESKILIALTFQ